MSLRLKLEIAFILLLFAIAYRVVTVVREDVQPDEAHWVFRSEEVIRKYHVDPLNTTTHLGHPGLVSALVMAAGQSLGHKLALRYESLGDLDDLVWSRLANAVVASFAIPILFLFVGRFAGPLTGFIAATLFMFDPIALGLSRLASVDGVFPVFVLLSLFLFEECLRSRSLALKILSGVCWGLSISIKPTALALLPAFWLYRLIRARIFWRRWIFLEWSDIGTIFAGHVVFALLYTRLWHHGGDYYQRLHIRSELASAIYSTGSFLHAHHFLSLFLFLASGVIAIRFPKHRKFFSLAIGVVTLAAFPAISENVIRFWTWTLSLSGAHHEIFGQTIVANRFGYVGLFLIHVPVLIICFFMAGFCCLTRDVRKQPISEASMFFTFCLLVFLCWISLLSMSHKQTWRYALPVIPSIYILAALGIERIATQLVIFVGRRIANKPRNNWALSLPRGIGALIISAVILGYVWDIQAYAPFEQTYENQFSRVFVGSKSLPVNSCLGEKAQALSFITRNAVLEDRKQYVTVIGDAGLFEQALRRDFPGMEERVQFGFFNERIADFIIACPAEQKKILNAYWRAAIPDEPYYVERFHDKDVLSLYSLKPIPVTEPLLVTAKMAHHLVGHLVLDSAGVAELRASPDKDKEGYLLLTEGYRVPAGKYVMEIHARQEVPQSRAFQANESSSPLLSVQLSDACRFDVSTDRLGMTKESSISLPCTVPSAGKISPLIKWNASIPVTFRKLVISRVGDAL